MPCPGPRRRFPQIFTALLALTLALTADAATGLIAGRAIEGTTKYANGGMRELDRFDLPEDKDHITCGVLDPDSGYAWMGADSADGYARIFKLRLEPGAAAPRLIAKLVLPLRHITFTKALIDPAAGYAYFFGDSTTDRARIFKIALGQGDAPPRLVCWTGLPLTEIRSGLIDHARGFACLGGRDFDRGALAKVALGQGDATPRLIGSIPIEGDEWGPNCSAYDPVTGHFWLGIRSAPPHIAKYALGDGDARPTRLAATVVPAGFGRLSSFVIDPQARYGYVGTQVPDADGWVIKVELGTGMNAPRVVGAVRLDPGDGSILRNSGVLGVGSRHALFCTESRPPRVVKIALGDGDSSPTLAAKAILEPDERPVSCLLADRTTGMVYLATNTTPAAHVIKVDCGADENPPRRVTRLTLPGGERQLRCVVVDTRNGYAYYGTEAAPARIVKVKLGDATTPPRRLGSLILNYGEDNALCGVIDPDAGSAWFGMGTAPGRIVKIALGAGDELPTRLGALILDEGEDFPSCVALDAARQAALWGTATMPGRIVKTALGAGSAPPSRVGALILPTGSNTLKSVVADPQAGLAWFGTGNYPGRIVQVAFGAPGEFPRRLGAVELSGGDPEQPEGGLHSAFLDANTGYAWFKGYQGGPGLNCLIKVALGGLHELPQRLGSIRLAVDNSLPWESRAIKGPLNKYGYAMGGSPGNYYAVKIDLGDGAEPPEYYDRLSLSDPEGVYGAAIYPDYDDAYFGNIRVRLSCRNLIVGSRITMPDPGLVTTVSTYAHIAEGSVRLALYSSATTPTLLWQSPAPIPITRPGWLRAPVRISQGRGLILPKGDVWLAWQVDTRWPTIGSLGRIDMGFYMKFPAGPFPAALPPVGSGDCSPSLQVFSGALECSVPEVNFEAEPAINPARGTPQPLHVVLSEPSPTTATVQIHYGGTAHRGRDYLFTVTSLTFKPGETRGTVYYVVFPDAADEPGDFIQFTLAAPVGARVGSRGTFIHTLAHEHLPAGQVVNLRAGPPVTEGDDRWTSFTAEVCGIGVAGPVEAELETLECGEAASGRDFLPLRRRITIPAGARNATVTVPLLGDAIPEKPERFQARLVNIQGAAPGICTATAIILDGDAGRVVPYLLGLDHDPTGLDLNGNGRIEIGDELYRAGRLAPAAFAPLQPAAGNTNVPGPVVFDWEDAARADAYDLYVWLAGAPQPSTPRFAGLGSSQVEDKPSSLRFNSDYVWQVVARNQHGLTPGPVRPFRTSPAFMELIAPTPGAAWRPGQSAAVHWRVNTRAAGTAVRFELWRAGQRIADLGSDYNKTGEGTRAINVPSVAPKTDYRLRLVSLWLERTGNHGSWIEIPITIR